MMKSMGYWARRAACGAAAGLAMLLISCGGGTEQVVPFEPTRYLVFGDAMSVLTRDEPKGRKYTVNAVSSTGGPTCNIGTSDQFSLLWTQVVGNAFNFVFEECNPNDRVVNAFIYAKPDAKSADFLTQLAEARLVQGSFGCNDLMSVLIGINDVTDLFETQYLADPTESTANALASELTARGARLGRAITELTANNGPNIIVSTIPLLNQTPYGLQKANEHPGKNVLNVLDQLSSAYNTALRVNIPNDGSRWGLVELDALVNGAVRNPGNFGITNWTQAVCAVDLPNCDNVPNIDLVPGGNAATWLWASDRWIGWKGHANLGSFARSRAQGNPFGCG
jgi:lysophospholipase L1-like esterase